MKLKINRLTFVLIIAVNITLTAQPELEIHPNQIEFEDPFHRIENAILFNDGDVAVIIDSIIFNEALYYKSFNIPEVYPISILPGDTIAMEIILSNYFNVTSLDTSDEMLFYYSNGTQFKELEIEIEFFDDSEKEGQITGKVVNDSVSTEFSKVYLYREGIYLYDTLRTDAGGNFSLMVHEGDYTLAVEKEGFYLTYFNNVLNPYLAETIEVDDDSVTNITVPIIRKNAAGNSVSGKVIDFNDGYPIDRGVIIVRKGKHDPTKMSIGPFGISEEPTTHAALINPDGSYEINDILQPGYYFIQAFPDFYIPSYYNSSANYPIAYWQDADSVYIINQVIDKDVFAARDSAYGAGTINGVVLINSQPISSGEIIVLAQNTSNNTFYHYNLTDPAGNFGVTNLPYGNYKLFAQTLGSEIVESDVTFTITQQNTAITNAELNFVITKVNEDEPIADSPFLFPNYPNPFNPETNIMFFNPVRGHVKLEIVNILGETIQTLYEGIAEQGFFNHKFDGSKFSSGIYLIRLITEKNILLKKAVLLK
ncbi:MAG: T9SS type A sorting domain-containing protein [Ignavibacteriae bacterium]|nr:T9SS C-terminal target domain-containing protein [Ignavibacteriota bacterium]NOH00085.1 T9SS type A sorting domain-containing protein [Ignavibacteriota bacterium]